jgi:transposase
MAMGKRKRRANQASMWVATQDLPRSAAHPFYTRLNQIFDEHGFDPYVEGLCERFYADEGRPGLPPGRYFRLLLIGYFEGLDAERAIAWRAADSFALREFLGLVLPEAPPDHSTISRTRRLIDLEPIRRYSRGCFSGWPMPDWSEARRSASMPPHSKRTRHCAASCGATPVRVTRTF